MPALGVPELLIILVIVILIFGASRLRGLGGALGGSIREFKSAVNEDKPNTTTTTTVTTTEKPTAPVVNVETGDKIDKRV